MVGDTVLLQSGDKIPADGLLVTGNIKVNNSALNGEREDCPKVPANDLSAYIGQPLTGDMFVDKSSLFRGAVVTDGEGKMLVTDVGMGTVMGSMAEDMTAEEVDSPLKVKLAKLAKQISMFGYIGAVVIAIAYSTFAAIQEGHYIRTFKEKSIVKEETRR